MVAAAVGDVDGGGPDDILVATPTSPYLQSHERVCCSWVRAGSSVVLGPAAEPVRHARCTSCSRFMGRGAHSAVQKALRGKSPRAKCKDGHVNSGRREHRWRSWSGRP